jgi:DNA repair ATPase RecN
MPSPTRHADEKAQRTQLVERVAFLETEIENLKAKLNDQTQIEQLVQRISNCESLAGIVVPKDE